MAWLNYSTTVDWDEFLINAGTNENGLVIDGQYITMGPPQNIADKYISGAIIINEITGELFRNAGSTAVPNFVVVGGGGGTISIGDSVGGGVADEILFVSTLGALAQSPNLKWDGTSFLVGSNRFSVNAITGFTQIKTPNSYILAGDVDNTGRKTHWSLDDQNRQVTTTINDTDGGFNRKSQAAVFASNAALYFEVYDATPNLYRFVTVDGEAVKAGSYETGGTNRNSNMTLGEAGASLSYGADAIVSRGVFVNGTFAAFTSFDIFPFVPLLGIDIAAKKAVTNYGERHKVRTIAVDTNTTAFDSDFIIVTQAINIGVDVTLPPSPANGDTYAVIDGSGTAAVHNTQVIGNGHNINGAGGIFLQGHPYAGAVFVYVEALTMWLIQSQF